MKTSLSLSLQGRDWWKPYLPYWIVIIGVEIVLQLTQANTAWALAHPWLSVFVQLGLALFLGIVGMVFAIIFLKILAPKLSYLGEGFAFQGKIGEFMVVNVVGILLSIVTIGVFVPWYIRRVTVYLASKTHWRGTELSFLGRGGRLFVIMLLVIGVPLIVLGVATALFVGLRGPGALGVGDPDSVQLITMLVTFFSVLYVFTVFTYFLYKWYVDFSWKDIRVRWTTTFWRSFGLVLGQVMLSAITLTIYWPVAFVRIYRYFVQRTVLTRGDAEMGRLGFEEAPGRGFGLIWGQTLLSVITAGIYLPWAYARIGRWLVGATSVERTDV